MRESTFSSRMKRTGKFFLSFECFSNLNSFVCLSFSNESISLFSQNFVIYGLQSRLQMQWIEPKIWLLMGYLQLLLRLPLVLEGLFEVEREEVEAVEAVLQIGR